MDSKYFWSFIKNKERNKSFPNHMKYGNTEPHNGEKICNQFSRFFANAFAPLIPLIYMILEP